MRNTAFAYLYRDASNYKQHERLVFAGELTDRDRRRIESALDAGEYFIADQVGLPELRERFTSGYEDDHVWHELLEMSATDEPATQERTISELADAFDGVGWDESAARDRLERWRLRVPRGS